MLTLGAALLAGAAASAAAGHKGSRGVNTSLHTIPVGYFGGLADPRTAANLQGLSKMRVAVIEKWEGPCWFECLANITAGDACSPACDEEKYQLGTIQALKAMNPDVATVHYMNTLYNFPYYKLAGDFAAANENVVGTDGKPISLINDDGMKNIQIMDFGKPSAVKRYLDFHRGLIAGGLVDGTFPDKNAIRASKNKTTGQWQLCEMNGGPGFGHPWSDACGTISESAALAYNAGKESMLKQLNALYGPSAPVFFSTVDMLGIAGWNQTDRQSTVKEITRDPRQWRQQLLQRLNKSEYVYCMHGDQKGHPGDDPMKTQNGTDSHCTESVVAGFLIALERGAILGCNDWQDDFGKPLGEPLGPPATDVDGVIMRREFALGAKVIFNLTSATGRILWPAVV